MDVANDYKEVVVQFGYISMFSAAFPVAPALALLNNLFESNIDLSKLLRGRRSPLRDR